MNGLAVAAFEVSSHDAALVIHVELAPGFLDDFHPAGVEAASEADQELVVVHTAVSVSVELRKKAVGFSLLEDASRLVEAYEELLCLDLPVGAAADSVESSPERPDSLGAMIVHLAPDFVHD